jgi:hypothetical protein
LTHIGTFSPRGVRFSIIFPSDAVLPKLHNHWLCVSALNAFKRALVVLNLVGGLNRDKQQGYAAGWATALTDGWLFGKDTTRKWH